MKQGCSAKLIEASASAQSAGRARGYVLNIAAIHEDSLPREWSTRVSHRAIQLVGPRCVRTARWTVGALHEPGALKDAILAAIEADILVVSVSAAGEMPLDVNRWIDLWLPRRAQRAGALVAVIGVPQQASAASARIRDYLRDVASLARLDFLLQEQRLPGELAGRWYGDIPERARASTPVLNPVLQGRDSNLFPPIDTPHRALNSGTG